MKLIYRNCYKEIKNLKDAKVDKHIGLEYKYRGFNMTKILVTVGPITSTSSSIKKLSEYSYIGFDPKITISLNDDSVLFKKKDDIILILPVENDYEKANELSIKLTNSNYNVVSCKPKGNGLEEKLLYHVFLLQLIALQNAKKQNLTECYFVNTELRDISSSLIY